MAAAHAWAQRVRNNIPAETKAGVTTGDTFAVSYTVADKIGPLRDAIGGAAVVLQHVEGSAFIDKPDLEHVLVLPGNPGGAVCCRAVRCTDVRRAQRLGGADYPGPDFLSFLGKFPFLLFPIIPRLLQNFRGLHDAILPPARGAAPRVAVRVPVARRQR